MKTHSVELLEKFVEERNRYKDIHFAVGYGSNVIPQESLPQEQRYTAPSRTDAIFVVENAKEFHTHTLKDFPQDYSWIRYLGPKAMTALQKTGGMISYNLLHYEGVPLKYGVIETQDLIDDLLYWKYLYVAGRLHKPHIELLRPQDESLRKALELNKLYALKVASVLLQDRNFSEKDLFKTITSLSYQGDPRLEDRNKIEKISKNTKGFGTMYEKTIAQALENNFLFKNSKKEFSLTPSAPEELLSHLPLCIQEICAKKKPESIHGVVLRVEEAVRKIVATPALIQIPKGLLTAGVHASVHYAVEKAKKSFTS